MTEYNDYPLEQLVAQADELIAEGATVYQKWTCDACGERVMSNEANIFHTEMHHEDCVVDPGHLTKTPTGNYLVIMPGGLRAEGPA